MTNRGLKSQSRTIKTIHTKSSMNLSGLECEDHSTEIEKMHDNCSEHLPTRNKRIELISPCPKDHVFQEQQKVLKWQAPTMNETINWNNHDEKVNAATNSMKKNDFLFEKKESSKGDEDGKNVSNSFLFLQEETKDCSSILCDNDRSSVIQLDDEKDYFSIPFFDVTLDTDEDSSFCLDLEGTDSEIQAAVNEIRREADQMDTIMILDQLKTLQSEFESVTKKCSVRFLENENLQIKLQESGDRVAHLELERDLYEADVTKLRDDLKTVVSKMFDISLYESMNESDVIEENRNKNENKLNHPIKPSTDKMYSTEVEDSKTPLNISRTTSGTIQIVGLADQHVDPRPHVVVRRSPLLSDPGLISMQSRNKLTGYSDGSHLLPTRQNHPLRNQNVFRTQSRRTAHRPRTKSLRAQHCCVAVISPGNFNGSDNKNNFQCRRRSLSVDAKTSTKLTPKMKQENVGDNKICGMFRRRSKQSFSRDNESVMKYQITKLHEMMKTSLAASEKLRKRIATVSKYYESVISKLQSQVVEIKTEKSRTAVDLTNRLSEADLRTRMIVSKLEFELRRKDEVISRLKARADRGKV